MREQIHIMSSWSSYSPKFWGFVQNPEVHLFFFLSFFLVRLCSFFTKFIPVPLYLCISSCQWTHRLYFSPPGKKKKKKKCTHLILAVFISLLFRDCNYIIKKIILFTSDLFVYIRVFLQASSTENFTKTQIVPDSETTSRNLFTTAASYL